MASSLSPSERELRKLLKKHVAAIHVSAPFGLIERKVFDYLLLQAYDSLPTGATHEMPAKLLMSLLGWERSENTEHLREALSKLVTTEVQFNLLGDDKKSGARWETTTMMSWSSIESGMVRWRYDEALASRLFNPTVYATISLATQQNLASSFSIALYQNVARFRNTGSTGKEWPLPLFRQLINATAPTYNEFKYLKKFVLTPAVTEINKHTDIQITPRFSKKGNKVLGIGFSIAETKQPSLLTVNVDPIVSTPEQGLALDRMQRLGISEKLAAQIVREHALPKVEQTVNYIEAEVRDGRVKRSPAGYLLKMLTVDGPLQRKPVARAQNASVASKATGSSSPTSALRQAKQEPMSLSIQLFIDGLPLAQRIELAREYQNKKQLAANTLNQEDGLFREAVHRLGFRGWLTSRQSAATGRDGIAG